MSVVIENLVKTYGKQNAVDNISFAVKTGEIVGFLGPNGAGKSTTMKIATGYLPPSQGTVKVCGFEVSQNSMEVRRNIGYLPEHNPLYLDMYVREYLLFIGQLHQIKGKNLTNRVAELVEICGLGREQTKKIASLSKGYRQRVGLAQALIHNPPVLILDEPTTGLDPNQIVEIRHLIKNIGKEKTVIISTHNMPEVEAVCSRAVIINLGKIVADNPVAELKTLTKKENIISVEFEKSINEPILQAIEGVKAVKKISETQYQIYSDTEVDVRGKIFKLAGEQNWTLLGLQQQESSLESVFQNLTQ
ncbi:MAG: gliding motility-associated ABC transporter ATP-binding subunit GldA [Microscillaceae bacterium]|jgi:ABC-2 type transport system ATP-binding protein|nr:gliding motility-associated ABC transporter ATP-binding subunit GldA [Microscillaceae bacterium]